jgi:hypothetical protein
MSVSGIINPATGKIYDELVPQGGGVPLQKGGLITANAAGEEKPLAVGTNTFILSADSTQDLGLAWIPAPAGGIAFQAQGQMLYAGAGPAYADTLLGIGNAGQVLGVAGGIPTWTDTGGSGLITANLPLIEDADPAPNSKISINFSNAVGEIPYGTATKVGALTNVPVAGQILGMAGTPAIPTWINAPSNVDVIVYRNSIDNVPLVIQPPATSNSTCIITADRTYHTYSNQIKNTPSSGGGVNVDATGNNLVFFDWTPATNIFITSMSINVYVVSNAQFPAQLNNNGDCSMYDAAGTQLLLASSNSSWGIINSSLVNFTEQAGATFETIGGTTYRFIFNCSLNQQAVNPTCDLVNENPLGADFAGNLTINGNEYQNLPATFTLTAPHKFRITNDLTGKTSATCDSFSSQSFVATGQQSGLQDWIEVGGQNGGVAYIP